MLICIYLGWTICETNFKIKRDKRKEGINFCVLLMYVAMYVHIYCLINRLVFRAI